MRKSVVKILGDDANRSAQPYQVSIVEGEMIEFSAPDDGDTLLSLTAETAALLDPEPDTLQVEIEGGSSVSYRFRKPANRSYSCQVLSADSEAGPIQSPDAQGDAVLTILSSATLAAFSPITRSLGSKTGRGL